MEIARDIFSYRKHWAARFGTAPFLPMSRAEMDLLGWDSCDVIVVTGDAYVDHPSFGMAIVGRVLEADAVIVVKALHGRALRFPGHGPLTAGRATPRGSRPRRPRGSARRR